MITNQDYLKNLVRELTKLPYETEWVEFKVNNIEPQMIGEYISILLLYLEERKVILFGE